MSTLDSFKLAVLTPKVPLTARHQDELEEEVKVILGSAAKLIIMAPAFGDEPAQLLLRVMARRPKLIDRVELDVMKFPAPYKYSAVAEWAMTADRIMAFPSRAIAGRIVDRVWGTVAEIKRAGRNVIISYPKDK